MITTTSADHALRLRDGRSLGYQEYGDPDGFPVFLFHGIPGSRRGASVIDHEAARGGVRVIGVDRPGIGLSTFQPGRSFLDWPADITAVADALNLVRFGVVGNSGGSAYVAACALCIPERLAFAGIISGMGPIDVPRWQEELRLPRVRRILIAIGRHSPYLACRVAGPVLQREIDPARPGTLERMKSIMASADQFLLDQPEVARTVLEDAAEALVQGSLGVAWDLLLYTRPWGFRLRDVAIPIHLWHGEADITVPPIFGRAMAQRLPHCLATYWPGEGHLMAISRAGEIIDAIGATVFAGPTVEPATRVFSQRT
ncbi:MAG: alpha/beta hydrolase [Nitrolancea sp.]